MPVKRPAGTMEASKQRFFCFCHTRFFFLLGEMEASKQRVAAAESGSTPPADLVQQSSRYSFYYYSYLTAVSEYSHLKCLETISEP